MKINAERLEAIQVVLAGREEDAVLTVYENDKKKGCWDILSDRVGSFGPEDEKTGNSEYHDISRENLLEAIKNKDLKVSEFTGWVAGEETYNIFDDWEHLAKYLGISELVVVSAKVPKTIAKRFEYFADNKSDALRKLIYDYVKTKMIENVEKLMFKEDI